MTVIKVFIFVLLSVILSAHAADTIKADHVKISWLAPDTFSRSESETIGLKFEVDPGWHVYWKNPGDSGAAPKFNFMSGDYELGPIQWPNPKRISVGHLVNIGYENEVAFLFQVKPRGASTDKNIRLVVNLEWLVCQDECIPGSGEMTLIRPLHDRHIVWQSQVRKKLDQFISQIPMSSTASSWAITNATKDEDQLIIKLTPTPSVLKSGSAAVLAPLTAPDIFPVEGEYVNPKSPQVEATENEIRYIFSLPPGRKTDKALNFLVVDGKTSWELIASPSEKFSRAEAAPVYEARAASPNVLVLLVLAFLGGIILNLMPCVLPVLSFKFLSIVKAPVEQRRKDALLYMTGVITTFFSLGAVLLILRSAGHAIGWGFQLQSPYIVLMLVLLFWLMSLNFLGFFEFGDFIMNKAGRSHGSGAFTTGILAVFVAAPCTGPFMGTALGAAATLPAISALGVFLSLGLGLALPFVFVSYIPTLYRWIPKPGVWMDKLKQLLAFPLLGTVIWLAWVLGVQLGDNGWTITASMLLLTTFSLWLGKTFSKAGTYVAWIFALVGIAAGFIAISRLHTHSLKQGVLGAIKAAVVWESYDKEKIAQARSQGRSVFVDFTAAWCVTCQLNKKTVLETETVQAVFQKNNVLLIRADWTNQDPVISQALEEVGRNSVPVYLFYENGNNAKILPQILTISMIEELFNPSPQSL